jgi:hypothetical protein
MNRKKILKKIAKKSSKTKVPELKDFGLKYMKMIYNELYDTFVIDLDCMINGTIIKIVGDVDPDYLCDGIRIETPKHQITRGYNCYELSLKKSDIKEFHELVMSWVYWTGDMLDNNLYDTVKHGYITVSNKDYCSIKNYKGIEIINNYV